MRIEIVTQGLVHDEMVREYIHRKLQFALDRLAVPCERAVVRLENETPGSPVFSGHCSIELGTQAGAQILVSARGTSSFHCVLSAIQKLEHAIRQDRVRQRRAERLQRAGGGGLGAGASTAAAHHR